MDDSLPVINMFHAAWLAYLMHTLDGLSWNEIKRQVPAIKVATVPKVMLQWQFPDREIQKERLGWYTSRKPVHVVPGLLFDAMNAVRDYKFE